RTKVSQRLLKHASVKTIFGIYFVGICFGFHKTMAVAVRVDVIVAVPASHRAAAGVMQKAGGLLSDMHHLELAHVKRVHARQINRAVFFQASADGPAVRLASDLALQNT